MVKTKRDPACTGPEFVEMLKASGFSAEKFAKLCGMSVRTIPDWKYGRRPVPKWAVIILKMLIAKRQALITGQRPTISLD